jgi:hypothetical protein
MIFYFPTFPVYIAAQTKNKGKCTARYPRSEVPERRIVQNEPLPQTSTCDQPIEVESSIDAA